MDKSRVYLAAAAPIRRAGDGSTRRVDHSDSLSSRGGGGYARKEKRTAIEIHLDRPPARNYVRLVALWSPAAVLTSNERTNVAPFITGTSTETPDTVYCSPPLRYCCSWSPAARQYSSIMLRCVINIKKHYG